MSAPNFRSATSDSLVLLPRLARGETAGLILGARLWEALLWAPARWFEAVRARVTVCLTHIWHPSHALMGRIVCECCPLAVVARSEW